MVTIRAYVLPMARIVFRRRGPTIAIDAPTGQPLLAAARDAGLPLANACSGEGLCKACRVEVLAGGERLSPVGQREQSALERAGAAPNERLACAAQVLGDVTVTTSYW